ncbi:UNVERIFIED_CONTAM: hypothetical protein GTU68_042003, partial [Idotea baltica]|nr:hypothetical protein [Idotea baltica]
FDYIQISLASSSIIKSWSYGEIKKSETINFRTLKPEKEGLFCCKIFGPLKDYECLCGKYKRLRYQGIICDRCDVEVTTCNVRRERMGHINLSSPIIHVWFLKSLPSRIGLFLDIALRDLERIIHFEYYVVLKSFGSKFLVGEFLTEDQYFLELRKKKKTLVCATGVEALEELLVSLNIRKEIKIIKQRLLLTNSSFKIRKLRQRLKLLESFLESNINPHHMILKVLPVLPPDLRPLIMLENGKFASSDLNDLYRFIINRNNRLRKLIDLCAPNVIVRNEKRMLQESVDALLDNGRRGKAVLDSNKRPLKSLASMIKGKQGRFRQNLLGKRVDYSGRSVIVVGPELTLMQCGLPKRMALELFKPFVYSKLGQLDYVVNIQSAQTLVEEENKIVWSVLEQIVNQHVVLLNRAPTLHRLGIQAFQPQLIQGKAIRLHPLVCTAFNADFDGDQMAVHVPLTLEAQIETRVLMMSLSNLLIPSSGLSIFAPTQDIVLGLYYLSLEKKNNKSVSSKMFFNASHILKTYYLQHITIHSQIFTINFDSMVVNTTVGRYFLYSILQRGLSFSLVNCILTKQAISFLILECYNICGPTKTLHFLDKLMYLGYYYVTISGISISLTDMIIPSRKKQVLLDSTNKIKLIDDQYLSGLVTWRERYNQIINVWTRVNDDIGNLLVQSLLSSKKKSFNSLFIMVDSGARSSLSQIRQLSGMRGLMSKPDGSIIETPIISSFREGLTVLEYFISSHGARKGLADTALRTANSGYLTRRLVDVAQDLVIKQHNCWTTKNIQVTKLLDNEGETYLAFKKRLIGRVIAKNIYTKKRILLIEKNTIIDFNLVNVLHKAKILKVFIRSPITCISKKGLCSLCYGIDLSKNCLVTVGEAVGIIAAQSIGEPGTQLTMRTFHTGGAETTDITGGLPQIVNLFEARKTKKGSILANISGIIKFGKSTKNRYRILIFNYNKNILYEVLISKERKLCVFEGKKIKQGDPLSEGPEDLHQILSIKGIQRLYDTLINKLQLIYLAQGILINDKHIEVIVKQMLQKIVVIDPGDSLYLKGDRVDFFKVMYINRQLK